MKKVQFGKDVAWIPGDKPCDIGFYWVTWNIDGSKKDTTEMFWDDHNWYYANDIKLHSTAVIHAYADIAYPEPYEE